MSLTVAARETLAAIERGSYTTISGNDVELRGLVDAAVRGTTTYRPEDLEALLAARATRRPSSGSAAQIELTPETTAEAGRRLVEREQVERVAALNFASARNPGGGFLHGAKAQEEDLARSSALYPCLVGQRSYYDANRVCASALYTDHIIYSPNVPFFRDERLRYLESPFPLSIISAPAPNAGQALDRDPELGPSIERALDARVAKILTVAADRGHRCLILGAWGCGAFRNDPAQVAQSFAGWLADERFHGVFERVIFAVYDPGGRSLRAFERHFGAVRM